MALTLRLEKESALTYKELDDNFLYLNSQFVSLEDRVSALYRTSPLVIGPCSDVTYNWNSLLTLNANSTYAYWAKQACTSSYPWWTGSAGKGILAAETYASLDPGAGFLGSVAFGISNSLGAGTTFAHGQGNLASGLGAHAEGLNTRATTAYSHTEGSGTFAEVYGSYAHAEGYNTHVQNQYSHAEGENTYAYGRASHAEGYQTYAGMPGVSSTSDDGKAAHAEGRYSSASAAYSHAEGLSTLTLGYASHAEGRYTTASFTSSHAEGIGTSTGMDYQHVTGRWNTLNNTDDYFVIGDGTGQVPLSTLINRSNAFGVNAVRMYASNSIFFPDLTQAPTNLVLMYSSSGQVFYTASSAIGGGGGGSALTIKDEGVTLSSAASSINFTGTGITATAIGNAVTVNVPGVTSLPIKDEGTTLTTTPASINFSGSGVTATVSGSNVIVNIPGVTNMPVLDEGNILTTTPSLLNFTGSGVTATSLNNNVTINIPSITIKDEGTTLTTTPASINFSGSGVTASADINRNITVKIDSTPPADPDGSIQWNDNGVFAGSAKLTFDPASETIKVPNIDLSASFIASNYVTTGPISTYYAGGDYVILSTPNLGQTVKVDLSNITTLGMILTIKNSAVLGNGYTSIYNAVVDGNPNYILADANSAVTLIYLGGGEFNILSSYKV